MTRRTSKQRTSKRVKVAAKAGPKITGLTSDSNSSPSASSSDDGDDGSTFFNLTSPPPKKKNNNQSPVKMSPQAIIAMKNHYKENAYKVNIRYAHDDNGATKKIAKFPVADNAYSNDNDTSLTTMSTYNNLLQLVKTEYIPRGNAIAEYKSASLFFDSQKRSYTSDQVKSISHSKSKSVNPISSDNERLHALALSRSKEQQ